MQDALETTASQKSGVDHLGAVGGGHNDDAVQRLDAVHACKKLVDDAIADIATLRSTATASH